MKDDEYEDGLYQARGGHLEKLELEDDGTKKIRVSKAGFDAAVGVQKRMRKVLNGHKPDLSIVAEAMLLAASQAEGIEEKVRLHAVHVFSGSKGSSESSGVSES